MDAGRYSFRFRSRWFAASPERVFAVLERGEDYPAWWPQVREVHGLEGSRGAARIRSVLPYDLWITGRPVRRDPRAGVLEMEITGDVEGWARWTVTREPGGGDTSALYEQQVEVRKPLLRDLITLGRPFFHANHTLMMRAGQRGLRRWLGRGLDDG
jgi:uncharacterized protein YndB with AHSA1/START domain